MKKIILVANVGFTLTNFRKDLIETLSVAGHSVSIANPTEDDFNDALKTFPHPVHSFNLSRKGLSPFKDLRTLWQLYKIFKREKPDIVLNYTIKPTIYSSIAAFMAGVAGIYSNITGLGYIFTGTSLKKKLIKQIIKIQYKIALNLNNKVFFQNRDDRKEFLDLKLTSEEKTVIINGSGVSLEKFKPNHSISKEKDSFLLIARLLKDKGIGEYVAAARTVKAKHPEAGFYLLGGTDDNPAAYSLDEVKAWQQEGVITYIPQTDDVLSHLLRAEVFVLPSYREGTPRSVLEALAMGLPVITTDAPGCRETVVDGENGFLVPVRESEVLSQRMLDLIEKPELKSKMGECSLLKAKEKYDVIKVNQSIMDVILK